MTRSLLPGLALSIPLAAAFHHVTLGAGTSCESFASLKLPNTTITLAQTVAACAFTPLTAVEQWTDDAANFGCRMR